MLALPPSLFQDPLEGLSYSRRFYHFRIDVGTVCYKGD